MSVAQQCGITRGTCKQGVHAMRKGPQQPWVPLLFCAERRVFPGEKNPPTSPPPPVLSAGCKRPGQRPACPPPLAGSSLAAQSAAPAPGPAHIHSCRFTPVHLCICPLHEGTCQAACTARTPRLPRGCTLALIGLQPAAAPAKQQARAVQSTASPGGTSDPLLSKSTACEAAPKCTSGAALLDGTSGAPPDTWPGPPPSES